MRLRYLQIAVIVLLFANQNPEMGFHGKREVGFAALKKHSWVWGGETKCTDPLRCPQGTLLQKPIFAMWPSPLLYNATRQRSQDLFLPKAKRQTLPQDQACAKTQNQQKFKKKERKEKEIAINKQNRHFYSGLNVEAKEHDQNLFHLGSSPPCPVMGQLWPQGKKFFSI